MVTEEEELEDDIGPAESFAETVYSRLDEDEKDSFLHEMKRRKTEQDIYEIDDESEHNGKTDVALTPPAASPRFSPEINSDDAKAISITASTEITTVPPNFTTETTEEANSKLPNVVKQEFPKTKMIKLQIKSDIPRYEPFTFKIKYEVPFEESFKIYASKTHRILYVFLISQAEYSEIIGHYGAELDRLVFVFDNKKISPTANAKSLQVLNVTSFTLFYSALFNSAIYCIPH